MPSKPSPVLSASAGAVQGSRHTKSLPASDGVPLLLAFGSALLSRSLRGGMIVVGGLSVGGSFEPIHNAVSLVELAVEKGASTVMLPVGLRRQLNDLSDEMAAKITLVYYTDVRDALVKGIAE